MQALATAYLDKNDAANAATYLEQVIAIDPTQKDVYFRLAGLYTSTLSDYSAAVAVLNKPQAREPGEPRRLPAARSRSAQPGEHLGRHHGLAEVPDAGS